MGTCQRERTICIGVRHCRSIFLGGAYSEDHAGGEDYAEGEDLDEDVDP